MQTMNISYFYRGLVYLLSLDYIYNEIFKENTD